MTGHPSRREFLQTSAAAAIGAAMPAGSFGGVLCFFSKPVPQMSWRELAQAAKAAGFGGIDLTVRRGGHVKPERATQDLPAAVEAIRGAGIEVPMITTELTSGDDAAAAPILSAAGKLGISYCKPGYYHYRFVDVRKELAEACKQFRSLVAVAAKHSVQVGFHNHSGYIGAPVWDITPMMDTLDPKTAGYYFDLEHATAEGGVGGWNISSHLALPRIKMLAVKDMNWIKTAEGWEPVPCQLGRGMCRYKGFLKTIASSGFHGPISLHLEYQIPGVSGGEGIAVSRAKADELMTSAKRDLDVLKGLLKEAYAAA